MRSGSINLRCYGDGGGSTIDPMKENNDGKENKNKRKEIHSEKLDKKNLNKSGSNAAKSRLGFFPPFLSFFSFVMFLFFLFWAGEELWELAVCTCCKCPLVSPFGAPLGSNEKVLWLEGNAGFRCLGPSDRARHNVTAGANLSLPMLTFRSSHSCTAFQGSAPNPGPLTPN